MKLFGTIVYPRNRYLSLLFSRGGKNVMCEDYFDNMVRYFILLSFFLPFIDFVISLCSWGLLVNQFLYQVINCCFFFIKLF